MRNKTRIIRRAVALWWPMEITMETCHYGDLYDERNSMHSHGFTSVINTGQWEDYVTIMTDPSEFPVVHHLGDGDADTDDEADNDQHERPGERGDVDVTWLIDVQRWDSVVDNTFHYRDVPALTIVSKPTTFQSLNSTIYIYIYIYIYVYICMYVCVCACVCHRNTIKYEVYRSTRNCTFLLVWLWLMV